MEQQEHAPRKIGKYKVGGVLGHGGMGSVYRAIDTDTGRTVALKLLNLSGPLANFLDESALTELFANEIKAMSSLDHPNIVEIMDYDIDTKPPYYTMEFFCNNLGMMIGENYTIEETSRLISPEKAVAYGSQVLSGLTCLHSAHITHRDIKPYNMMVTDKNILKISDFGMARFNDQDTDDIEGMNIGSPYYSAPEQIRDPKNADERSDLYSAGVLIYRMLTGELAGMKDFMLSHVDPLYDVAWDQFFAKALCWNPEERFQDAREMAKGLQQLRLHWHKRKKRYCPIAEHDNETGRKIQLRTEAVRVSGTKARKVFRVNGLWQPRNYIVNDFKRAEHEVVEDQTTDLMWLQTPSDHPLDRQSADAYIQALNDIRHKGIGSWRLPTVNELLSLIAQPDLSGTGCLTNPFVNASDWFWTSDRRTARTSWYVNITLGYTGWQHDRCLYSVRAVSSRQG